jgi:hypothetical protein
MNIGQIKILSWLAAALLTLGLSFYVYRFLADLPALQSPPDTKKIRAVLEAVEPYKVKTEDLVAYDDVVRLMLPSCDACKRNDPNHHHLNWTGKPKEVVVEKGPEQGPVVQPKVSVKELVAISMIKVDLAEPQESTVFLRYKPRAAVQGPGVVDGVLLHASDHLAAPHDKIRIDSIGADAVVFAFEGGERENETLGPTEFSATEIVQVGPDGVVVPKSGVSIPHASGGSFRPGHTTSIGDNKFVLGTEDVQRISDDWPRILTEDVRHSRHQDPRTGKYDGIELNSIKPNSLAASHGAQEGDVIKSINGQPVTSVNEAITYVKNNANQFTTWEVVVESKGKLVTKIYHSPQQ